MTALKDDCAGANAIATACSYAPLLLDSDEAAATRWQTLDDSELDAEIECYRAALRALREELNSAAAAHPCGPAAAAAVAEPVPSAIDEDAPEAQVGSLDDVDPSEWQVPPHCVPIHANVTTYDWSALAAAAQFDVIMMDPPWALATANPTRGVSLGYSQLTDADICALPVPRLQTAGFLFVWVINAKFKFVLDLFDKWGYDIQTLHGPESSAIIDLHRERVVDEVVWVKMTVHQRLAKSHGYYLQHAKEVCLVGRRGPSPPGCRSSVACDVIYSERRGQSQKPEEIYHLIEELVPNGRYLELFGRKNNLRNYWVTIGNEVTGTGLPMEDRLALDATQCIPGAVFGARHPSKT